MAGLFSVLLPPVSDGLSFQLFGARVLAKVGHPSWAWVLTERIGVPLNATRITRRYLIHLRVTHGRRLYDRSHGLGLLDLTRERNAGASRTDHGKHKYFLHEDTPWNRRAHPAI